MFAEAVAEDVGVPVAGGLLGDGELAGAVEADAVGLHDEGDGDLGAVDSNAERDEGASEQDETVDDIPAALAGGWQELPLRDFGGQVVGKFIYSEALCKINAHCLHPAHTHDGVRCKTDALASSAVRGSGRPLGFLTAWLLTGSDFSSKDEHADYKSWLRRRDSRGLRQRARAFLHQYPHFQVLFALEREHDNWLWEPEVP